MLKPPVGPGFGESQLPLPLPILQGCQMAIVKATRGAADGGAVTSTWSRQRAPPWVTYHLLLPLTLLVSLEGPVPAWMSCYAV